MRELAERIEAKPNTTRHSGRRTHVPGEPSIRIHYNLSTRNSQYAVTHQRAETVAGPETRADLHSRKLPYGAIIVYRHVLVTQRLMSRPSESPCQISTH